MFTARLDPDTAGARAGQRGLLLCRVDSDPPAQLRLLHRDCVVASSLPAGESCSTCGGCSQRTKVTRAPNLLRVEIQDPVLEDEGMYLCEASSLLGNASASATFNAQGEAGQGKGRSGSGAGTRDPIPLQPPALRRVYGAKPPLVSSGSLLSSPCPMGTPEGLLPTPSRQGGWTTGTGVWGEAIKVRPVSVGLCCLFSSHCPGHHTIAHAAGGHWSQSDLQGGPGSRWPCQLLLVPGWGTVGPGPPGDPDAAARDQKGCCPVCLPHPHRGWCPAVHPCGPECALWVMGKGRFGPLEGGRGGLGETGLRLGLGRQERGSGVGKCGTELHVCVGWGDGVWQVKGGELGWGWPELPTIPADPPDPPKLSALLDVDQGHTAVFICTVDSRPLAQLSLFHGEHLLATSPGPRLSSRGRLQAKATANSLQLEVQDLSLGDSGSYRCEATNVLGSANTSLFFQVRGECRSSEAVVDPSALGATLHI